MTFGRRVTAIAGFGFLLLAGCTNPSFIGVQDYGSIYGNAVSSTNAPISQALVSSTGSTIPVYSSPTGAFSLSNVAVGEQTVTISAPGYGPGTMTVIVTKNMPTNAGNIVLATTGSAAAH